MNASDESDEMRWWWWFDGRRRGRKVRGEREVGTSLILHDDRH